MAVGISAFQHLSDSVLPPGVGREILDFLMVDFEWGKGDDFGILLE
jgi:hypothetical protein